MQVYAFFYTHFQIQPTLNQPIISSQQAAVTTTYAVQSESDYIMSFI